MKQKTWCNKHKRWHTKHALRHCKQHRCGRKNRCTLVKV